jgi:Uncharacterized protein involved in cation transport
MWRPGFEHVEARPALLKGYHRAFCISSTHYRGRPPIPGSCWSRPRRRLPRPGLSDRRRARPPVARYLHEREMVTGVYEPRWVRVVTREGR